MSYFLEKDLSNELLIRKFIFYDYDGPIEGFSESNKYFYRKVPSNYYLINVSLSKVLQSKSCEFQFNINVLRVDNYHPSFKEVMLDNLLIHDSERIPASSLSELIKFVISMVDLLLEGGGLTIHITKRKILVWRGSTSSAPIEIPYIQIYEYVRERLLFFENTYSDKPQDINELDTAFRKNVFERLLDEQRNLLEMRNEDRDSKYSDYSNPSATSSAYYNDSLDFDQQSQEFWDDIG